jgi:hypothetical protein
VGVRLGRAACAVADGTAVAGPWAWLLPAQAPTSAAVTMTPATAAAHLAAGDRC